MQGARQTEPTPKVQLPKRACPCAFVKSCCQNCGKRCSKLTELTGSSSGEKCRNPAPGIALREAISNHKIRRPFLTHEGIPDAEGFGHVGLCRTTVSFDTALSRKLDHDGCQMPAASFFRRCWHLMVLQTTCSAFGARGLQTSMATGAPYAPWPIVSLSYRTKAHDLTLSLAPHPVCRCKLFLTSNST